MSERHDAGRRPGPAPRLTVVIPAFEEAGRIAETVARLRAELADVEATGGLEVLVVDDGSSDDTVARAQASGAGVVRLGANHGKGAAVRTGLLAARGRAVAFTDADLAYDPADLRRLLAAVEEGWDVAVGSRGLPGCDRSHEDLLRRLAGRLFNVLAAATLLGRYRDTQCGLKAFRAPVARSLASRGRIDGFAFDVELFHLIERDGWALLEVPVRVSHPSPSSSVRMGPDALRMAVDVLTLWWRARRRPATGPAAGGGGEGPGDRDPLGGRARAVPADRGEGARPPREPSGDVRHR